MVDVEQIEFGAFKVYDPKVTVRNNILPPLEELSNCTIWLEGSTLDQTNLEGSSSEEIDLEGSSLDKTNADGASSEENEIDGSSLDQSNLDGDSR